MIDYLYQTTDFKLFVTLSCFFIAVSITALFFIKWLFPLHLRYQENAVIGHTSALIGVIYGVIAGFATIHLINNNNYAMESVQREANAIANIYRDSQTLNEPTRTIMQTQIKDYLNQVLNKEWPLMNVGKSIPDMGDLILARIASDINHLSVQNTLQSQVLANMLEISNTIYNARHDRILSSYSSLSNELWVVIIIGTILTLCVSYLFGVNFYLHIFTVTTAALMTSSVIFLLISLDKPYQGQYSVGPEEYQAVATFINNSENWKTT
jgi:hypothetical protein